MSNNIPYQLLDKPMYHMCVKDEWTKAVNAEKAYFPPTFEMDGRKTHASMQPNGLLATANHFCKPISPPSVEWICVELNPKVMLETLGVATLVESPQAVGDQAAPESTDKTDNKPTIFYPHIYGGIATKVPGVVTRIFPMTRSQEDGTFLDIPGLLE